MFPSFQSYQLERLAIEGWQDISEDQQGGLQNSSV
jgi:hypothetical protein